MSERERKAVRILFVEDTPDDVELELAALRAEGFEPVHRTVETADDLRQALVDEPWDVIICDYVMPELSGLDALRIVQKLDPDVPFILVSGTIGEEVAVEAMRAGAHDYVLEDNLTRLAPAVERELREVKVRRHGRLSRQGLQLLADAGAVMTASLDYGATLHEVARLAVGDMAWLCIIDLMSEDETLYRAACACTDAARADEVRRVCDDNPPDWSAPEPALLATLDPGAGGPGQNAAFLRIARALRLPYALAVPLRTHEKVVGALELASERPFTETHQRIVEELGRRAAAAIENARLYEQARQAIYVRDEFLSIASHELKTPLTAAQLQIDMVQKMIDGITPGSVDPRLQRRVARASHSLERLALLVESLLDVSRISSQKVQLEVARFDLAAAVRDVVERVREQARHAGSELVLSAAEPLFGCWDRRRLEQVLVSLLANAIKYGPGKPIEVEVARGLECAILRVIDHGIGVPPADLERIFERFERAVSSRNYGGLGLGLYITRQIVEAHGGIVTARATPGGGATFQVELPLDSVQADGSQSAA
jgi:signal transduction histidine kinase/ActR/RegA family two-component response regulator